MSNESQSQPEDRNLQDPKRNSNLALFFYGTLQNPAFLQSLLSLPSRPTLHRATLNGFKIKLWGAYPMIVPDDDGTVEGMVWDGATSDNFTDLEYYETDAYAWREVDINLLGQGRKGEAMKGVRVFVARDPEDDGLEDGVWTADDGADETLWTTEWTADHFK